MLEHYDKINWREYQASTDYDGYVFIQISRRGTGIRLAYGVTVKDCMNTYLCVVMGVKPRFPVV